MARWRAPPRPVRPAGPRGPAPTGVPAWLDEVLGGAAAEFELPPEDAPLARAAAGAVLTGDDFRPFWRDPAIAWAGDEVPVSEGGEALRIDRLVARDEPGRGRCWWVLDYKLDADPAARPAYRAQMDGYLRAVRALQPGDRVVGAFVADGARLQVIPG